MQVMQMRKWSERQQSATSAHDALKMARATIEPLRARLSHKGRRMLDSRQEGGGKNPTSPCINQQCAALLQRKCTKDRLGRTAGGRGSRCKRRRRSKG